MSKSLLAKLTASVAQTKPLSTSSSEGPTVWTASLNRQDNSNLCGATPHVLVVNCPLSMQKFEKGCICRVRAGLSPPFLISISSENVRQTTTTPNSTILLCPRLSESVGISKDVREVTIEEVVDHSSLAENTISDLVISVKDRYVSKRDLWSFQIRLLGSVVYKSLSPPFGEMLKCSAVSVLSLGESSNAVSGIVGPQTRIAVRSFSAQLMIFLSITRDLWDFDYETKEPVFMKMISGLCDGLARAINDNRTHHLLLIGTCRAENDAGFVDYFEIFFEGNLNDFSVNSFKTNLIHFFKIFPHRIAWLDCPLRNVDGECPDWFVTSPLDHNANFVRDSAVCGCKNREAEKFPKGAIPCHSSDANILESINLALNHFSKHHMDRRLGVTGTQITFISACNSSFRLLEKSLMEITRKRVESTSCSIRVISLGPRPIANKSPVTIIVNKEQFNLPWLWFSFYTSTFPAPVGGSRTECGVEKFSEILFSNLENKIELFTGTDIRRALKPPQTMSGTLASSTSTINSEKLFKKPILARERRSDSEIIDLGIVTPRLQRVAIEASVKSSDIKPIDNWTVPGEGLKTFHDLIGTRLAMDMQIIDASGTLAGDNQPVETLTTTTTSDNQTREKLSTSFGVLVSRSSMRDTHIQKVMIKSEDKCVWMLNRLESGNIYVSRVFLSGDSGNSIKGSVAAPTGETTEYVYEYVLRSHGFSNLENSCDIIACKSCQDVSSRISCERRKFFVPPPLPWNSLDDVIVNPYIQQSLPSTVPNNAAIPQEMVGIRWKFRSAIRTAFFALVPKEPEFVHSFSPNTATTLGSSEYLNCPVSPSSITSRFLDWIRKVEKFVGVTLPVSVGPRKITGFVPTLVRTSAKGDWYLIHMEPQFSFPRVFVLSIEWILCQSSVIESLTDAMEKFATEDGFNLVQLPHAQLFPQPAPSTPTTSLIFDQLPFHQNISLQLPLPVAPMCYTFLVSRMIEQMGLLLLLSGREYSHPEGFSASHGGGQMMVYSRLPGWILMERRGNFFVSITSTSVEWITSRFSTDEISQSEFLKWKQIVHTSIVDSSTSKS